ncbi:hypothetical protein OCJ37_03260 [Xanthomonas sp. AM6]|uniref:hypothetical protein n=1 Tax=Xanthomonas sp. AM6 TaxID=2982531 RepID=UPI0021D9346C|nr:hypothetical protein [Xanthomonas sp. AM6]UYB52996.1 hypothetical protein OCJ37_03260 [Xanthomonas sp. AM6]
MSNHDSRTPVGHDVRQAGDRGGAEATRDNGSHGGGASAAPSRTASGQAPQDPPADAAGADRSGQTQPNFGQAGTYGATGEHAGGAHGRAASGGYHEDASGEGGGRDERAGGSENQ